MAVLTDAEIRTLVHNENLIENFDEKALQGASYDLGVGRLFSARGEIKKAGDTELAVVIQPGQFIVLTSREALNLPLNMVGHFGLISTWGMRGVVPLFGPQIDPGFSGILVVPVFNAGDAAVSLPFDEKMFTVEFVKMRKRASFGWSQRYGRQERIRPLHTAFENRPNLADISDIGATVKRIDTELRVLREHLDAAVNRVQLDVSQGRIETESRIRVIEGRIDGVRSGRNWLLAVLGFTIAIITFVAGLITSPWFGRLIVGGAP